MNKMAVGIPVGNTFTLECSTQSTHGDGAKQARSQMTRGVNYALLSNLKQHLMVDFILANWAALLLGLMAFAKVVVNLTPTTKDNMIFGYVDLLVDAIIPDRRKGK